MFNDTPAQKQIGYWVSDVCERQKCVYTCIRRLVVVTLLDVSEKEESVVALHLA